MPNSVRSSAASFCSDMEISLKTKRGSARAEVWCDLQRRAAGRRPFKKAVPAGGTQTQSITEVMPSLAKVSPKSLPVRGPFPLIRTAP
ncbi:hypothetical protein ARTHRO8AJ_370026 [Arthrobacter sp. 8AJ]|nr:hypothetical protein ARTHRO8AJ_370026 [Arthrobacter sp. 8AJ]